MSSENENQKTSPEHELLDKAQAALREGKVDEAVGNFQTLLTDFEQTDEARRARDILGALTPKEGTRLGGLGVAAGLLVGAAGLGFWWFVFVGIATIFSASAKAWFLNQWKWILAAMLIAGALAFVLNRIERYLATKPRSEQRTLIAFIVVPFILFPFLGLVWLPPNLQAFALELVLIVVACLIPAAAYYLFLATRRPSILNEFIGNLSRLGLLSVRADESATERVARIDSYFQRFEGIYGSLRFEANAQDGRPVAATHLRRIDFVEDLLKAVARKSGEIRLPEATVALSDILRPNLIIPLGLATILSAMGWVLVLQPEPPPIAAIGAVTEQSKGAQKPAAVSESASGTQPKAASPAAGSGTASGTQPEKASSAAGAGASAARTSNELVTLTPAWSPINFAFLGAYFFGIQMLFRRFVRRDLGPNAYLAFANRIVLSIIAVWVVLVCYFTLAHVLPADPKVPSPPADLAALLQSPLGTGSQLSGWVLATAFVVGVFPRVLWQFIGALFAKLPYVDVVVPGIRPKQPLDDLDGITVWHEARLEEEDVENIPNMASVDIVDLMLRTQFPAERLLAWIDQAILFTVLGAEKEGSVDTPRARLRGLGLRTATQLVDAFAASQQVRSSLEAAFRSDPQPNPVFSIVNAVQVEANFDLVCAWRGLPRARGGATAVVKAVAA